MPRRRERNWLWVTWYNMKKRCTDPANNRYHRYGARGVCVCDEWLNDFKAFETWAKNNGYKRGLTIDRIDNNGNYEPSNCRWVSKREQANNTVNNRIETYMGVTDTVANLCRLFGKDYGLVANRLKNHPIDVAMSDGTLITPNAHFLTYKGETKTLSEWNRELGFKRNIVPERLKRGWTVEEALSTPAGGKRHG